jgi:DNA polymerase III delta prime subunit
MANQERATKEINSYALKQKDGSMSHPAQARIKQSIEQAQALYNRLVLVVGDTGSGKTGVLRALAGELGTNVINVNLALSGKLVELTERQRTLSLGTLFNDILEKAGSFALLDNTEILFDRNLRQDPLRLLQSVSRNRCVVASWNGAVVGSKLTYAATGHPEFRSYDVAQALIVKMDDSTGFDARERQEA